MGIERKHCYFRTLYGKILAQRVMQRAQFFHNTLGRNMLRHLAYRQMRREQGHAHGRLVAHQYHGSLIAVPEFIFKKLGMPRKRKTCHLHSFLVNRSRDYHVNIAVTECLGRFLQ